MHQKSNPEMQKAVTVVKQFKPFFSKLCQKDVFTLILGVLREF